MCKPSLLLGFAQHLIPPFPAINKCFLGGVCCRIIEYRVLSELDRIFKPI